MGASRMSDFAVGSNEHCFFCLNQIIEPKVPKPPQNLSSPIAPQTNSLQYLTRYLRMDLKKVFTDKGHVSLELLAKVEKAKLKVELCEDCCSLSEKFSKVYRQLEKLELELESTLGRIHGKLARADATDKLHGLTSDLDSDWNGLLEVLKVLRAEAIITSSHKLFNTPRVKIQRLTTTELKAKQFMTKTDEESSHMAYRGLQTSGVNMKSSNEDSLSDNGDGNNSPEDANSNLDSEPNIDFVEMESGINADDTILHQSENSTISNKLVSRTTRNTVGTGKCIIDQETGKQKCKDCCKKFNGRSAFSRHYETVHLKLRYKCVSCNKLFSQRGSLTLHQRTSQSCSFSSAMDSATKFNCHICEKRFSRKDHLKTHLDGVHFRVLKYECNICEKKFMTSVALFQHRRQLHSSKK